MTLISMLVLHLTIVLLMTMLLYISGEGYLLIECTSIDTEASGCNTLKVLTTLVSPCFPNKTLHACQSTVDRRRPIPRMAGLPTKLGLMRLLTSYRSTRGGRGVAFLFFFFGTNRDFHKPCIFGVAFLHLVYSWFESFMEGWAAALWRTLCTLYTCTCLSLMQCLCVHDDYQYLLFQLNISNHS